MRVVAIIWASMVPGLQVYLFRRIREDLVKTHVEGPQGFHALLAPWSEVGMVQIVEDEIRFWNGSKIYLCHCKDEKDRFKYLSAEIHVLLIDELTTFTDTIYRFLRSRVRAVGLDSPGLSEDGRALLKRIPRILNGSNPGNVGHLWVKGAFIDDAKPMDLRQMPAAEGGLVRQYIPARLSDNPSIMEEDPSYVARLQGLGSEALVRAMLEGDWDVIEGAFFDLWNRQRHVIKPFAVPHWWPRIRAFDWGSAVPFSYGEYAVSDGEVLPDGRWFPPGALIKYLEWYGVRRDDQGRAVPNKGLKMDAEDIAERIKTLAAKKRFQRSVADPSIFNTLGGPSIGERMAKRGVVFGKADNARVARHGHIGGWDQVRARLRGDEEGRPMLYFFDTCLDTLRTLPALQHDELNPEDLDTDSEDHAADELRYACMARPYMRPRPDDTPKPPPPVEVREPTLNELIELEVHQPSGLI